MGAALLRLKIAPGDVQLLLYPPQVEIGGRRFRGERDQHKAAVFNGGLQIGVGGFDAALDSAKDVDFPRRIEPGTIEISCGGETAAAGVAMSDAGGGVEVWIQPSAGDDGRRPRLANPRRGLLEIEIPVNRPLDQRFELG